MYDPERHTTLSSSSWRPKLVRATIQEIVTDAVDHFDAERYWPAHPLEDNVQDGTTGLYFGAAGVLWGMDFLQGEGAARAGLDIGSVLPGLLERNRSEFASMAAALGMEPGRASYFMGDLPILLMMLGASARRETADELHRRIVENLDLPVLELMWGLPGAMLTCVFAERLTADDRWRALYLAMAERLLGDLQETELGPMWTQALYGRTFEFLGAVHGFAGNMQALLRGWNWLGAAQQARVSDAVLRGLEANRWSSDLGSTWHAISTRETEPTFCQHCHGAPGMITAVADPNVANAALVEILEDGGRFTWRAGPLKKGPGLCHGTAGNGYAFLKLHRLTGHAKWLDRARAFAVTAIDQYRSARAEHGRGRYSLWTGDIGLAIYLHECLKPSARFPAVDVF